MADSPETLTVSPQDLDWLIKALKLSRPQGPSVDALVRELPRIDLEAWPAGREVVREGDRGEDFFVIYEGELSVRHDDPRGPQRVLGTLKAGDFFGEIGFLMESARSATVRTESACRLFRFSAAEFHAWLKRHSLLEDWIERVACERIEKMFY